MKQRSKYTIGITSVVLAGSLGFATMASASGGDDGDTSRQGRRGRPSVEQLCERQDDIVARAARAQSWIDNRVAALTERHAAAEAAGETRKVAWIDKHLDRLAQLSERIEARLARFQTWAAEHCG